MAIGSIQPNPGKSLGQSGQVLTSTGRAKARGLGEWSGFGLGCGLDLLALTLVGRVEVGAVGRVGWEIVKCLGVADWVVSPSILTESYPQLYPQGRAGLWKTVGAVDNRTPRC